MEFNIIILITIFIVIGFLINLIFFTRNEYYVTNYQHCLLDINSNYSSWRAEVVYEGFFGEKVKTMYFSYLTNKQGAFIELKLEESLKNKRPLKIK